MAAEYFVGIMYHEPESYDLWIRGLIEDYESSTALFITADSAEAAIAWGEQVGQALLRQVNHDPTLDWKSLGYFCWVEQSSSASSWSHCLDFFPHVRAGEWPDLKQMTTAAYTRWLEEQGNLNPEKPI